mmetsp:Transcript_11395/g.21320  ORF Transcript_11395/g.21320 Transcript_11395/m.21320 type:complete len:120 (+) Transcript_11395:800-1159(+)
MPYFQEIKTAFSGQVCDHDEEEHVSDGQVKSCYDRTSNESSNKLTSQGGNKQKQPANWGLVLSNFFWDSFHNFCDGVFVGAGLSLCEKNTAYTMVTITLYHEVAQKLADYFLLTRRAGL